MSERNDMDQLLAAAGLHVYRTLLGASASVIRKTQLQQSTYIHINAYFILTER
jgi:hypothetical protein